MITSIVDSVYVYSSSDIKKRNSIIVLGMKSALLIDPSCEEEFVNEANQLISYRQILVLYSHSHVNHLEGANRFSYSRIYAHELMKHKQDIYINKLPLPTDTYENSLMIDLGDYPIRLENCKGHLDDLSIAFILDKRILFTSDLVLQNSLPFVGEGDFFEYKKSIEHLRNMKFDILIPGHGKCLYDAHMIDEYDHYIQQVLYCKDNYSYVNAANLPISQFQISNYEYIIPEFHAINLKKAFEVKE